jgi:hypothetical protein
MNAAAKKAAPRVKLPLRPADPLGARFCEYFNHPWNFIWAIVPESGEKTQWTTENRYPLQPRNLWEKYQDPNMILGLRFGSETRYALIDIDRSSSYHPENNLEKFQLVLGAAEKIGLCRNMLVRSSESGGLHIYFFLPEPVTTFGLACAMKFALLDEGLQLGAGQLEIFPNVKAYNKNKPTNYNGHRLPLQSGSYLLDADLQPVTNDIFHFLNVASMHTTKQDMEELKEAIAAAVTRQKATSYNRNATSKAQEWKQHLESRISQGWTGLAQTNDLLKDITCYGIVWQRLSEDALIDYVVETAINAPGYGKYCRHQQEIRHRAAEWVHTTENNQFYTPYCSIPQRLTTYSETYDEVINSGAANNVVPFRNAINEERSAKAMERVKEAIAHLEFTNTLPFQATTRAKAITEATKKLFGTTVSKRTLHKKNYLPLWHPKHREKGCVLNELERVTGDEIEPNEPISVASVSLTELMEPPEALPVEASPKNPTPPPYMKGGAALSAPDVPQGHLGAADFNLGQSGSEENISHTSLATGIDLVEVDLLTRTQQVEPLLTQDALLTQEVNLLPESTELTPELALFVTEDFWRVNHQRLLLNARAQLQARQQALKLGAAGRFLSVQERKALQTHKRMQLYWESGELALMEEAQNWAEEADKWPEVESKKLAPEEYSQQTDYLTDDEYYAQFMETDPVSNFGLDIDTTSVPEPIPPSKIGDRALVLVYDRRKLGGVVGEVVSLDGNHCRLKFNDGSFGDFAIEDVQLVLA